MGDPSLVLRAELMGTIDAAHAKHDRRQPEASGIIHYVLIRCAFGATVWTVKVEWTGFADAGLSEGRIDGLVSKVTAAQADVFQPAVYLVGRSEYQCGWHVSGSN